MVTICSSSYINNFFSSTFLPFVLSQTRLGRMKNCVAAMNEIELKQKPLYVIFITNFICSDVE